MKFQGIFVAAATPFDYQGDLYKVKVQHNIEKWNKTSVAGYVMTGSAGEGPLLSADEKAEVWDLAAKWAATDKLLLADVTAEGVRETVALANRAAEAGCKAVVCGVPHHYKSMMYGESAQTLYYRAVADQSRVPVIIHNAPAYTGVDIGAETAIAIAQHPNVAGVIETGTPVTRLKRSAAGVAPGFGLLTGSASDLWEALKAGATGAVLAFASAAPYAAIAVWEAFRTREEEAGIDWQSRISHPNILVTDLYGVAGLKHAMDLNGYYGGPPRLPLTPVNGAAKAEIAEAFRDLKG